MFKRCRSNFHFVLFSAVTSWIRRCVELRFRAKSDGQRLIFTNNVNRPSLTPIGSTRKIEIRIFFNETNKRKISRFCSMKYFFSATGDIYRIENCNRPSDRQTESIDRIESNVDEKSEKKLMYRTVKKEPFFFSFINFQSVENFSCRKQKTNIFGFLDKKEISFSFYQILRVDINFVIRWKITFYCFISKRWFGFVFFDSFPNFVTQRWIRKIDNDDVLFAFR